MMKVSEAAELAGVSVRTLHHYDEIGLFSPEGTTEAGYRLYSDDDLERLQQILFFRELGFPLKQIRSIIGSPTFDRREALELQRQSLLEKRSRLDRMLALLDKSIRHAKGEIEMSNKEKFEGFDFSSNPYEQEARERWGDAAVDESNAKLGKMSKQEQEAMGQRMNEIYAHLASLRHESPEAEAPQAAIKDWYDLLNTFGTYSPEAFRGLGQMYVDDVRFTNNIDKFGEGLAVFMRDAMAVYADRLSGSGR